MNFQHPIEAVIPGARGRVLTVLARTTEWLNVSTIGRLAEVSTPQASRVLEQLLELGMVERTDVPPSILYRLVRDHVASSLVLELDRSRERFLDQARHFAQRLSPAPRRVVVFGSLARGEAQAASDVDILVVRPREMEEDDPRWERSVEELSSQLRTWSGNPVSMMLVDEDEFDRGMRSKRRVWRDIEQEGITLVDSATSRGGGDHG